jgi:ABC-type multidrug transport system ATPase subunit
LNLITELRREGHTVLLTTHFIEEADRLCDRIAIMDHGRVLALDTPTTLKRSLGSDTGARSGFLPRTIPRRVVPIITYPGEFVRG